MEFIGRDSSTKIYKGKLSNVAVRWERNVVIKQGGKPLVQRPFHAML